MGHIICPLCDKELISHEDECRFAVYCTGCGATLRMTYKVDTFSVWDGQQKDWQSIPNSLDKPE
jgi:hypothetical protein